MGNGFELTLKTIANHGPLAHFFTNGNSNLNRQDLCRVNHSGTLQNDHMEMRRSFAFSGLINSIEILPLFESIRLWESQT